MSLRSRARRLQRQAGITYQQALARLRAQPRREKIPVIELARHDRASELREVCERLLTTSQAAAVLLIETSGRVLVHLGAPDRDPLFLWRAGPIPMRPEEPTERIYDLGEGRGIYFTHVGRRAYLGVRFDPRTSLGLVRLRARHAVDELERLLATEPSSAPAGGTPRGGPGGLPAHIFAGFVADLYRRN